MLDLRSSSELHVRTGTHQDADAGVDEERCHKLKHVVTTTSQGQEMNLTSDSR